MFASQSSATALITWTSACSCVRPSGWSNRSRVCPLPAFPASESVLPNEVRLISNAPPLRPRDVSVFWVPLSPVPSPPRQISGLTVAPLNVSMIWACAVNGSPRTAMAANSRGDGSSDGAHGDPPVRCQMLSLFIAGHPREREHACAIKRPGTKRNKPEHLDGMGGQRSGRLMRNNRSALDEFSPGGGVEHVTGGRPSRRGAQHTALSHEEASSRAATRHDIPRERDEPEGPHHEVGATPSYSQMPASVPTVSNGSPIGLGGRSLRQSVRCKSRSCQ